MFSVGNLGDWASIVGSEIENASKLANSEDSKTAHYFAPLLQAELISQIESADMPAGVKNALKNSISITFIGSDRATISISAIRPSIYSPVGLYPEGADLALIYDKRKKIKKNAIFYNPNDPDMGVIPIGRIPGFARGYLTNYLTKTANAFMGKHPECIVTVSK